MAMANLWIQGFPPHRSFFDFIRNGKFGGPGQSPTADLRVRSALLYATELPGHVALVYLDVPGWITG